MAKIMVQKIYCKNFRCFDNKEFLFTSPLVFIVGDNGSGKTSLLEALFFASSVRSFKTFHSKELPTFNQLNFFLKIDFNDFDSLQIGFLDSVKKIRFNNSLINNHQQLASFYQAVALTQDDLGIIQESPEYRRLFLDSLLCQMYPEVCKLIQKLKAAVSKKNELLSLRRVHDSVLYDLLTEDIIQLSNQLKEYRINLLNEITEIIAPLQNCLFSLKATFKFLYKEKKIDYGSLLSRECQQGRVLHGAHLDDFEITINTINVRFFGSRGQQKGALFILKIAHIILLIKYHANSKKVFLVDDFISDLDQATIHFLIDFLLTLDVQIFLTMPIKDQTIINRYTEGQVFNLSL